MNVIIEDTSKKEKKLRIFYITLLVICVAAIILALILQKMDEENPNYNGNIVKLPEVSEENASKYKEQFNEIFNNKVNYLENNAYKISKINKDEEIVYLGYQKQIKQENDYELNVNIPYINIKNETVEEFNNQIKEIFEEKAISVLNTQNKNVIYTVDYSAYVSNNILSIIVRSKLKEGGNPQRDIVQTYNYDLKNHKKCTLDTMLEMKNITKNEANQKIKYEIKEAQKRVEDLSKLGLEIYPRDYKNDIYDINNATDYFMGEDNTLYIIYAYGNLNHTSEMDIVVM